jgi:hypothetical protein
MCEYFALLAEEMQMKIMKIRMEKIIKNICNMYIRTCAVIEGTSFAVAKVSSWAI